MSEVILTNGQPVPEDRSHTKLKPDGQQESYVVLTEAERAKGFVRPVRTSYRHVGSPGPNVSKGCGSLTSMGQALAETYARDPKFYSGTFCANCGKHFPVGENGEFVWAGTNERVGT
jgi:hypothetical protein